MWKNTEAVSVSHQDIEVFFSIDIDKHKRKNSLKTPKMHFLPVFELTLDSLTTIYIEPHQCPSHQSILLNQGPISEIFVKKF